MLYMITGAIIASVFFILGYYVRDRQPKEVHSEEDDKTLSYITNEKGFYSYRKYSGVGK